MFSRLTLRRKWRSFPTKGGRFGLTLALSGRRGNRKMTAIGAARFALGIAEAKPAARKATAEPHALRNRIYASEMVPLRSGGTVGEGDFRPYFFRGSAKIVCELRDFVPLFTAPFQGEPPIKSASASPAPSEGTSRGPGRGRCRSDQPRCGRACSKPPGSRVRPRNGAFAFGRGRG